ncbi:MAG: DNA-processing protein DprA [Clostridia bacterium]|nr:DNA-processing protein DprA [Clostridia bacterium]
MTQEQRLWLWLNYATEHNPKLFYTILQRFDSIEEVFDAVLHRSFDDFGNLDARVKERMLTASADRFLDRYIGWIEKNGIGITTPESEDYPTLLNEIVDPPSVLFYRGTMRADLPLPIAVVGSRSMTDYGKEIARLFGSQIAEHNGTVVTGLAAGIDSEAAKGALSCLFSDHPVIGVIPCGIDLVYPSGNERLYEEVAERGCLMTEMLPKTSPQKFVFPMRNRILSGLSRGVLVVEAGERSGTSLTVDHAHDQGRDVFAIPGRLTDLMSVGTNRLIARGEAKPVTNIQDILSEYEDFLQVDDGALNPNAKRVQFSSLSRIGQEIYMALLQGEKNADDLLDWIDATPAELNAALTELQFSEVIRQLPGRMYTIDALRTTVTFDEQQS